MKIVSLILSLFTLVSCVAPHSKEIDGELLMYGQHIPGKLGFVRSPHSVNEIVDVRGFGKDTKVRCPYTGKVFLVPRKKGVDLAAGGDEAAAILANTSANLQRQSEISRQQSAFNYSQIRPLPQIQPVQAIPMLPMPTPIYNNQPTRNATIWHPNGTSTRVSGSSIYHPDGSTSRISY